MNEPSGYSPYECIYRTLAETVRGNGADLTEFDVPRHATADDETLFGRGIPDGAVLVAANPRLALSCEGDRPRLDKIAYTEYRGSVELAAGRVTTLYLGLETVGLAAAELLQSRVRSGNSLPARTVRLSPKVIPADAAV